MKIKINKRQVGCGTRFVPEPRRLHLGGERAEGVDRLEFELPEEWDGRTVSLYIQHEDDGKLMLPVLLDAQGGASVGRAITEVQRGMWMLGATNGAGYTAYTVPGEYDVYDTLDTSGDGTEIPQNQFEQFVAQVAANASTASNAASQAQAAQAAAAESAQSAAADAATAEAAAQRAEAAAPEGGNVISVNGKGGIVTLNAADVGATPAPIDPVAGEVLVVRDVLADGSIVVETTDAPTGGGGGTTGGGFIEIDTNIPTSERVKNTLYWLKIADLSVSDASTLSTDAGGAG